jgi:hypothetical protein
MTEPNYKRIVYCMKLWMKEIQEDVKENGDKQCVDWIVATWENEIGNGTYCENAEYNEYLITGKI